MCWVQRIEWQFFLFGALNLRGLTLQLREQILHLCGETHDTCADIYL